MGMVMIFLRMRGPGADGALREPARMFPGAPQAAALPSTWIPLRRVRALKIQSQELKQMMKMTTWPPPSTPGVLRRVKDAPDGSAAIPPGFRPAPARAPQRRGVSTKTTIMFKASREPPRQ